MKPVFIRPYRPADATKFSRWMFEGRDNQPDGNAIFAPSSFTVCAFTEEKQILFSPVQSPMFLESLAVNPEASELEQAAALKAVVQFLVSRGYATGQVEVYFLGSNQATAAFAEKHLFEKVDLPLYRVKLADLEPPPDKG